MKSLVIRRPIIIAGRMTGVTVEDAFWNSLKEIAEQRHESLAHLIDSIDAERKHANLSSAIRLYVLGFYRDQYQGRAALDPSIRQSPTISHSTICRL